MRVCHLPPQKSPDANGWLDGLIRWMVVGVDGGILKVFAPIFGFSTMQADISNASGYQSGALLTENDTSEG